MSETVDVLQGSLDLLILKTLSLGPLHGWGVSTRLRDLSRDVLQVNQGSLYPALYRLQDRGWISAEMGPLPDGRRVKFYAITPKGRKHFTVVQSSWRRFATAVEHVLQTV